MATGKRPNEGRFTRRRSPNSVSSPRPTQRFNPLVQGAVSATDYGASAQNANKLSQDYWWIETVPPATPMSNLHWWGFRSYMPPVVPSVRSFTVAAEVSGTTLSVTKPTGVVNGDVVSILTRRSAGGSGIAVSCTGFTVRQTAVATDATDYNYFDILDRTIDGSEGSSFSVNVSSSQFYSAIAIAVKDTSGIDVSAKFETVAYSLSRRLPTVTTTVDNCLLIGGYGLFFTPSPATSPSGWTQVATTTNVWGYSKVAATAGATGNTDFNDASVFELPPGAVAAYKPL